MGTTSTLESSMERDGVMKNTHEGSAYDTAASGTCAVSDPNEVEYYRRIDECANTKANVFIENGLPVHALYLLRKMFSEAQRSICLFSGNLCLERENVKIYSDPVLIENAKEFLRRGGELRIVIENNLHCEINHHPMIAGFNEVADAKVKVAQLKSGSGGNHFVVVDDNAYRIEHDDGKTKAIANFGDNKVARERKKYFDTSLFPFSDQIYPTLTLA